MFQLVESICIENKRLKNIELHNNRFNDARIKLFSILEPIDIEKLISIPDDISNERYKCRLITDGQYYKIEIEKYLQRKISTLKVVVDNNISYSIKTTNRTHLDKLFELRDEKDDIVIVKNNLITDSWAANILLFDGREWITPKHPLLKGVQREYLLRTKKIIEKELIISDLPSFQKIKLVNAMIDFERAPEIEIVSGLFY